jgi:hypothetical protein
MLTISIFFHLYQIINAVYLNVYDVIEYDDVVSGVAIYAVMVYATHAYNVLRECVPLHA